MSEEATYEAILREQWEKDHIPNCPNCRRAQPDYWAEIFTQVNFLIARIADAPSPIIESGNRVEK